eukprot:SAG31_NODE_2710_length_5214_cov_1.789628_1_plen_31_part_10
MLSTAEFLQFFLVAVNVIQEFKRPLLYQVFF